MYLPPIDPKLRLMKSSMKRSGFGFQTWKFQKPPKNFILETKKDTCFPFHFHVLNLFKSWSNLGFDKHGLDIFKLDKSCIYPPIDPKLRLMKPSMKRSGFGFQ